MIPRRTSGEADNREQGMELSEVGDYTGFKYMELPEIKNGDVCKHPNGESEYWESDLRHYTFFTRAAGGIGYQS
jgi:hypothetical protein